MNTSTQRLHRTRLSAPRSGETWWLSSPDSTPIPAEVPGSVHPDLLAAGALEDPYYRDNERLQFWIGETDWTYHRAFTVTEAMVSAARVLLRCHGLDTLATIRINGSAVGSADNMFRTWEFDVKPYLLAGENRIEITLAAPMPYLREAERENGVCYAWSVGDHRLNSGAWIRKSPCNFGWDWGPKLVTSGIWRDIDLVAFSEARLTDIAFTQDHTQAGRVLLTIHGQAEVVGSSVLNVAVDLMLDDIPVAGARAALVDGAWSCTLEVEDPQLWWINGLGGQPLYTVHTRLMVGDTEIDSDQRHIGLRVLRLERQPDTWGESFTFSINGVPFFAKGANWIPADSFPARLSEADYEGLIASAAEAHMNMLRVWGGGIYESDAFYDLCDRYGIAVWQDFMFACGTYPADNDAFMENVRAEAEDNVRRLRHHAALALWCGNNEIEQGLVATARTETTMSWDDYSRLFDALLPSITRALDPQRDYWPGSPHSPCDDREFWFNPTCGDTHLWGVWHAKEPLEWYRLSGHRFVSEFGFQSFPEPSIIRTFTLPEDRALESPVMTYHQRSGIGNTTIMYYMRDWFREPTTFEAAVWMSQILQGFFMKYAIEHWRRSMPQTMGTLYWQLNDLWPAPSWSSLDYRGNWKALHYMAKRFYAPLLISAVEDAQQRTMTVYVTNDHLHPVSGTVTAVLMTPQGDTLHTWEMAIEAAANASTQAAVVDCAPYDSGHAILWLALRVGGEVVSRDVAIFARFKDLDLPAPAIQLTETGRDDEGVTLALRSDVPALWVWLEHPEHPVRFSDNFFHLMPGDVYTVRAPAGTDAAAVRVWTLTDTYAGL